MNSELKIYKLNNDTFRGHKYPNGVYIEGLKIKPISYYEDFTDGKREDIYRLKLLNYKDGIVVDYRTLSGNRTVFKDLLRNIFRKTNFEFKTEKPESISYNLRYEYLDYITINCIITNRNGSIKNVDNIEEFIDLENIKRVIKYVPHFI